MSWIFWILLAVSVAILLTPFATALTPEARFTLWFTGSIVVLALILWVVATVSRAGRQEPVTAA